MLPSGRFGFEKWYMDVADASGNALIAYRAALSWGTLRFGWQSVVHYPAEGRPERRSSVRLSEPPVVEVTNLHWAPAALGTRITMTSSSTPMEARLWEGPASRGAKRSVDWRCVAPRANVEVALPTGAVLTGPGYAECLAMTVVPWKLPLRELRWGRWHGDDGSVLTWIDWRGGPPRRWCWLDGAAVQASVGDDGITGDGFTLALSERRTLEHRSFTQVAREVPGLFPLLPQALRRMQESKWLSTGSMQRHGAEGPPITGRAIHEVVVLG